MTKNIFNTIDEYNQFLLFLNSKPSFTIPEIAEAFNISYDVFYTQVRTWKDEDLVEMEKLPPELGAPKQKFMFSDKGIGRLKEELMKYMKGLQVQEKLLDYLDRLKDLVTPVQLEKIKIVIKEFYQELFKV
ncbi:MAG: hypothetical protein JSV62_07195 [Promethearchaeota archaeon]|nr:MAG: hypothetical protein JSV62_07195 [Candidatus Lokiarchaeota archaeon]